MTNLQSSCPSNVPYGYVTEAGYWGFVPQFQSYILFATEGDYLEYLDE